MTTDLGAPARGTDDPGRAPAATPRAGVPPVPAAGEGDADHPEQAAPPRGGRTRAWLAGHPRAVTAVAAVAATVATWSQGFVVGPGLDHSWELGVQLWAAGQSSGRPVDFPTGPLGAALLSEAWTRAWAAAGVAVLAAALTTLAYRLLRRMWQPTLRVLAIPVVWVLLTFSWAASGATPTFCVVVVAVALTQAPPGGRRAWAWCAGLGAVGGLLVLGRPNEGLIALLASLAAAASLRRPRWAGPAVVVGAVTVVTVSAWAAVGLPLRELPSWLARNVELASGYSAMATPAERWWTLPLALALVGACGLAVCYAAGRRWWVAAVVAPVVVLEFKHGLVRADHTSIFWLATLVLLAALSPRPGARLAHLAVVAGALMVVLTANGQRFWTFQQQMRAPLTGARLLVGEVATVAVPSRWAAFHTVTVAAVAAADPLPATVRAALHGGVQVDPFEVAALWPGGVHWAPVPVFQLYSAYTPALDDLNAAALAGPQAPDTVLRDTTMVRSIDARFALFDSPAYQLALDCRYVQTALAGGWQVLARGPQTCGTPQPLASATLRPGQWVTVPAPRLPGDAVVARITLATSWADRLTALVYKPAPVHIWFGGHWYRLDSATASQPLLMREASWMPAQLGGVHDLAITAFSLTGGLSGARVSFLEVPRAG